MTYRKGCRMRKKLFVGVLSVLLALMVLVAASSVTALAAEAKVKVTPSKESYAVKVTGGAAFICNATPIDTKVGSKMYMTYTVREVTKVPVQQGLGGCADSYQKYPYRDGGFLYYGGKETMLKAGYTYFVEFTVTEKGFEYVAACGKDDKLSYTAVNSTTGQGTADMKYLGLWLDGSATAYISNIHFYLADGTDLGIRTKGGALREYTTPLPKASDVPHTYEIAADGKVALKIGNKLKNTTDKMYIEYTVVSDESAFRQSGFGINGRAISNYSQYKYAGFTNYTKSELLTVGASYLIELSNSHSTAEGWQMLVQRTTADGKTDWFKFSRQLGTAYTENYGYSYMTFTDGGTAKFELKDFKIYDANHKSLGVKTTGTAIKKLVHHGQLESYADCDIAYYNKQIDTYVAIYPDNTIKITKAGITSEGTYYIEDGDTPTLVANIGGETKKFTYAMSYLIDESENRFVALSEYTVNFVTGTDQKIDAQKLNNKTGYVVKKPDDPKLDGDEFVCWITRDGKEYDFNSIQNASVTLYAKWKNKAGATYTAIQADTEVEKLDLTPFFAIGITVLIFAVTAVGFVILIRRFKKQ